MIERTPAGRVIFESRDGLGVLLSETATPYWLRKPPTPPLLRAPSMAVRRDPETLDLFASD